MQPFLYQVSKDLKHRFGDDLSKTAVVFNNKRPVVFLKKHLAEVYGKTIICPAMFTIQEFMALSTSKAIAQDLNRFFLLFECYNQLLQEEGKEPVGPEFFFPLSQTILSDFDQIDYERVNPEALFTYLKDLDELKQRFSDFSPEQQIFIENFWSSFSAEKQAAVQQKFIELWKRLPRLYSRFNKRMAAKSLTSIANVYRQLAEGHADNHTFIDKFQQVAFVGFNALNKCEASLFQNWASAGKAIFYFDGDEYYFNDPIMEAGMFLRKSIHEYGLKNALGAFPNQLNTSDKQLITYPISGNTAQAKALPIQLKANANSNSNTAKPNKTAVILADENLLTPTLQSISDDSIINVTMGFSIRQSSVFELVQHWISAQQQLQSTANTAGSEGFVKTFLSLNLLEFKKGDQQCILKKYQQLSTSDFIAFLQSFSEATKLFFTKNKASLQCIESLKALIKLVLQQKEAAKTLKQLEAGLLLRVYQELSKLGDLLIVYQPLLTIELNLKLIKRCLSVISTPLIGEPLEGIQIMGMLESRCLDFDEVYILSANEGILPYSGIANTFIPDSLRRAFGLPVKEYQEALSAYLFYRLCQRAGKVHVFYNSLVDNNSNGEISRFVSQLAFESRVSIQERVQAPFPQGTTLSPAALSMEKTEEVISKLNQYAVPGKSSFSASALKKYLECPLQFFMQYLAGIKESVEPKEPFDPAIMGTAFHQIMQDFYLEFEGKDLLITKEIIKEKLPFLPGICRKALLQALPIPQKNNASQDSRLFIAEKILLENARLILHHDAENIAPFKILELENDCSCSFALDIHENRQPEVINFKGIIDRIDEVNGRVRIVDYKTGGGSVIVKNDLESLFSHQTKQGNPAAFQLFFYSLLYYKKYGKIAEPHLYIIRKIAEEGTAIQLKAARENAVSFDFSEQINEFENNLSKLIGEIFNPQIAFKHNPDARYCSSSPYALFCSAEAENETEEPEAFE